MCHNSKTKTRTAHGITKTNHEPDGITSEALALTQFLTVQSDPNAEQTWERFSCNDAVRGVSPEYLKSLQRMFADKPAGEYLVKVEISIQLTTLDFEPKAGQLAESPDLGTQTFVLATAGVQVEATEHSEAPWTEDEDRF